jgi:hypothetical protein
VGKMLKPNLTDAARFLDILEPGGTFWFQTASEPKPNGKSAAKVLSGTLNSCATELAQLNESGSAVWVQINAGAGRKNADVDRIRAYFVDLDSVPGDALFASPAAADMIIESSPGKYHGYWLTKNTPLQSYSERMHVLADRFGGDHAICNLSRVMRLPGFYHLKGTPFMARIAKTREGL